MENPVGTGPYRLKSWTRGQRIVLEANPDFRDDAYPPPGRDPADAAIAKGLTGRKLPLIGNVDIAIVEEAQPRMLSFDRGLLDYVSVPPSLAPTVLDGRQAEARAREARHRAASASSSRRSRSSSSTSTIRSSAATSPRRSRCAGRSASPTIAKARSASSRTGRRSSPTSRFRPASSATIRRSPSRCRTTRRPRARCSTGSATRIATATATAKRRTASR